MNVHFSSEAHNWETPKSLFDQLNQEFSFTLDPCCEVKTAKCKRFYTKEDDGLSKSWENEVAFVNPPYGREQIKWIVKAHEESKNAICVLLIPSRTDTKIFHELIFPNHEIRFLKGRLYFSLNGDDDRAPFPSMLVVMRPEDHIGHPSHYASLKEWKRIKTMEVKK
jgi:site-specific DNA-methyltransferase (adenine-specific)